MITKWVVFLLILCRVKAQLLENGAEKYEDSVKQIQHFTHEDEILKRFHNYVMQQLAADLERKEIFNELHRIFGGQRNTKQSEDLQNDMNQTLNKTTSIAQAFAEKYAAVEDFELIEDAKVHHVDQDDNFKALIVKLRTEIERQKVENEDLQKEISNLRSINNELKDKTMEGNGTEESRNMLDNELHLKLNETFTQQSREMSDFFKFLQENLNTNMRVMLEDLRNDSLNQNQEYVNMQETVLKRLDSQFQQQRNETLESLTLIEENLYSKMNEISEELREDYENRTTQNTDIWQIQFSELQHMIRDFKNESRLINLENTNAQNMLNEKITQELIEQRLHLDTEINRMENNISSIIQEFVVNIQTENDANSMKVENMLKHLSKLCEILKEMRNGTLFKNEQHTDIEDKIMNRIDDHFTQHHHELLEDFSLKQQNLSRDISAAFLQTQNETQVDLAQLRLTFENYRNDITLENPKLSYTYGIYPHNCAQAIKVGGISGIYEIQLPLVNAQPFSIYCELDPNGGPAWAVVQRRCDGSHDFYRNWHDYRNGFGDLLSEHFIGLQKIYEMTNVELSELWIKLEDFRNETRSAKYSRFAISNVQDRFRLYELGEFFGDIDDAFSVHKGSKFSTKDMDNDSYDGGSCAQKFKGGWWYYNCLKSNLNGLYLRGAYVNENKGQGVTWGDWHGYKYSLKYTQMAIRPVN